MNLNKYYVYKHIRPDTNEVFYVGRGKLNRAYSLFGRNNHWKNIVNNFGYKVEILETNLSFEEANLKEIELIKFYGRRDLKLGSLVNLTNGGEGTKNAKLSIERIEHIRKIHTGKINSEKTKSLMSKKAFERFKDKNNHPCTGRPRTQQTKDKLSEINKQNIGDKNSFFGKKHSEETKKIIGEKSKGRKANLGNIYSEASKQKMRDAWVIRKAKAA